MIKKIRLALRGRPILLITRMIRDRIGLHSVLLPIFKNFAPFEKWIATRILRVFKPMNQCHLQRVFI